MPIGYYSGPIGRILLLFTALFAVCCLAQEIPLSQLPPKMQAPVPDYVLYHMFLRHLAIFQQQAQQAGAAGQSSSPWQNHILHKFGLTPTEQQALLPIALQYETQWKAIRQQEEDLVKSFKASQFPSGGWIKGQPLPSMPSGLLTLRKSARNLSLQTRNQLIVSLGAARFASLDMALRRQAGIRSRAAVDQAAAKGQPQ